MSNVVSTARTNNLAAAFQEVLTAILRVRDQPQMVTHVETFRGQVRQLLQTAMNDARGLGTPASAEWSRRPLQEELFGGHLAGETVFRNLQSLLQQQDAPELADVLELHCITLELGYKGRYAFSTGGELRQMVQLCREKIRRARGSQPLFAAPELAAPVQQPRADTLARVLLVACIVLAVLTVAGFAMYEYSLSAQASRLASDAVVLR